MSKVALGDIAMIRTGVTLRGRDATRPDPNGSVSQLRISDLSDDGELLSSDLVRIEPSERIREDAWLRRGDVLFPNRGTRNTAHVWAEPTPKTIAGAQFFIVRPDTNLVLPDYLAWYLRSEPAFVDLHARKKGTLVQILQVRDLQELKLPLPSLAQQDAITALDTLAIQERKLSEQLLRQRFTLAQNQLLEAASANT